MQTEQEANSLGKFMDHLKDLLYHPPYLVFFFTSTFLLIISLTFHRQYFYNTFLAVFLFSLSGVVWRHAVKDMRGWIENVYPNNFSKKNFWITAIYHLVNLIAIVALIVVIVRYCI